MRNARATLTLALGLLLFVPTIDAKISGVFQGKIIKASARYLYVQGKSGFIRKVEIAHASVDYDDDFPAAKRVKRPAEALKVAANVLVRAEQRKGTWQASEVVILAPTSPQSHSAVTGPASRLKN